MIEAQSTATDWLAAQLRLSLFPLQQFPQDDPQPWWAEVVGVEPLTRQTQPRERSWRDSGSVETPNLSGVLQVSYTQGRIDWMFENPPNQTGDQHTAIKAANAFHRLMENWLSEFQAATTRIAFGSVLTQPIDNADSGRDVLSHYLPFDPDPGASDFLYQVNKPIPSGVVENRTINVISKWYIERTARLMIEPGAGKIELGQSYSARLELDINNSEPSLEIPSDDLPLFFEEFIRLAVGTMVEGP